MGWTSICGAVLFAAVFGGEACAQTGQAPGIVVVNGGGTYDLGQRVTLTTTVSLADPASLTYRWRKDNVDVPGQTAATLTIAAMAQADVGNYQVTVENFFGTRFGTTRVNVRDVPLQIASSPTELVRQVGQAAIFTFSAVGRYPRTYQ